MSCLFFEGVGAESLPWASRFGFAFNVIVQPQALGMSPVGIACEVHRQPAGLRRRNGTDASSHHRAVHLDFAGSAAAPHAARWNPHPRSGSSSEPVGADGFSGFAAIGPMHGDGGHQCSNGLMFTCCSNASARRLSS